MEEREKGQKRGKEIGKIRGIRRKWTRKERVDSQMWAWKVQEAVEDKAELEEI